MAAKAPTRFTGKLAKRRRRGRILIDYLRNVRGATAVGAYSLRTRAGAPAATPVSWQELEKIDDPRDFNYATVPARLNETFVDPWVDLDRSARALTKEVERKLKICD
jgi:bifunctional non-homologous end joining protein LigD